MYALGIILRGEASGHGFPLGIYNLVVEKYSTEMGIYQCHLQDHPNLKIIKRPEQLSS